jgi:hypothetical protein
MAEKGHDERDGKYARRTALGKEMNYMASLAFAFPLKPCKAEEWRCWGGEILGPRRSEYQAFRRRLGLGAHRMYLQHTPQGDTAIMYLEGDDLQRTFQELRTSQDPFIAWFRQRTKDLLDGLDLTQTSLGLLSKLVFDGPGVKEDEAWYHIEKVMERLGMISP